jgi:hypothetical protein
MEILVYSIYGGKQYLFFCIPAEQVESVGPVAEIDADGSAFGDDLVAIDEIGKVDGGIAGKQLRLVHLEPLVFVVLLVEDLLVLQSEILELQSDAFS